MHHDEDQAATESNEPEEDTMNDANINQVAFAAVCKERDDCASVCREKEGENQTMREAIKEAHAAIVDWNRPLAVAKLQPFVKP